MGGPERASTARRPSARTSGGASGEASGEASGGARYMRQPSEGVTVRPSTGGWTGRFSYCVESTT